MKNEKHGLKRSKLNCRVFSLFFGKKILQKCKDKLDLLRNIDVLQTYFDGYSVSIFEGGGGGWHRGTERGLAGFGPWILWSHQQDGAYRGLQCIHRNSTCSSDCNPWRNILKSQQKRTESWFRANWTKNDMIIYKNQSRRWSTFCHGWMRKSRIRRVRWIPMIRTLDNDLPSWWNTTLYSFKAVITGSAHFIQRMTLKEREESAHWLRKRTK